MYVPYLLDTIITQCDWIIMIMLWHFCVIMRPQGLTDYVDLYHSLSPSITLYIYSLPMDT